MELLSRNTWLGVSEDDGATYLELYGLTGTPDMGGEPNKVDVTNLRDKVQRSIDGNQQVSSLQFPFNYNNEKDNTVTENMVKRSFAKLKELEDSGKLLQWKLTYPDGTSYAWSGRPTAWRTAANVDEPLKFNLSVSLESALEYADALIADTAEGD